MPLAAALLPILLAAAPVAGDYRLTGVHDAAAELVLRPDGRFEYALAYGALDEESSGRWTLEGSKVVLTTEPKPVPPAFSPGDVKRTEDASLAIKVVWPDGRGVALVDFRILFADGSSEEGYTQEDGWTLPPGDRRVPRSVQLTVPMHGQRSPVFPLDAARGNAFTFLLTPNDFDRYDFDHVPLDVQPGRLVQHRGGESLTWVRRDETPRKR